MADPKTDIAIIGGGIVGLATALQLTRLLPRYRVMVLEKENKVASHQSGHNSGVIHSGIYYKPGSLKAKMCVSGAAAMVAFCREHGVPHEVCGKVIVATLDDEVPRLKDLFERGKHNGLVVLRLLGREELREIEPHCGGLQAIHVPRTGITDYSLVAAKYVELIQATGSEVLTGAEVTGFRREPSESIVETKRGAVVARFVINCAGLYSDRVSDLAGEPPEVRIVPFRGEYFDLVPERHSLVRALIYPVPDPRFPFLGVHLTRRIHGGVDAGPNAVLALKREGYHRWDFDLDDAVGIFTTPGFFTMAKRYWRHGGAEFYRSLNKRALVAELQRLVPEIQSEDLVPDGSGVRAQALKRDGSLVDDFQFVCRGRMLHVDNVPSPAATASLAVGEAIAKMAKEGFGLEATADRARQPSAAN
jgi:L-2-hydroxyglutarate oxidase LhgO